MAKQRTGLNLKPLSVRLTFIAFALFLAFAAFASFGLFDLTNTFDLILGVTAVLVIFVEAGLAAAFRSRGRTLDVIGLVGITAGVITLVTIVLEFMAVNAPVLNGIQGVVFGVVTVSFFIEAFRN